jgi:hypothetical protein
MSTATIDPTQADFISAAEATRRHPKLSPTKLYRLAAIGAVAVDLQPGVPPRYSAGDIERALAPKNKGA